MITQLLIIAALPWLLLFVYQISRRGFAVLLIWLLLAPAVMYLVQRSDESVLYKTSGSDQWDVATYYYEREAKITLQKLFNPTRTVFGLFLLVFLLNVGLKRTRYIPLDTTEKWMSIFSLILLTNVLLWSGRRAFGLHVAVDAFIVPFLAYYFTRRFVVSDERFAQLTRVIAYMAVYVIVFCLIERFTTSGLFYRVRGPFESANTLHPVLAVAFFTALSEPSPTGNRPSPSFVRRFVVYLTPIIIALTLTRGNWVGFLAGLAVFLFLSRPLVAGSRQGRTIGWGLILLPIALGALHLVVPEEFVDTRVANPENVLGRFATWIATIQLASEAPILGVGLNNLHGLLPKVAVTFEEATNYSTPHNSALSVLVELGIVGLVAYLAIVTRFFALGLSLYRTGTHIKDRWRGLALVAIIVAYLTPSLFANTMYALGLIHVYPYVFTGAIAGLYSRRRMIRPLYTTQQYRRGQVGQARAKIAS